MTYQNTCLAFVTAGLLAFAVLLSDMGPIGHTPPTFKATINDRPIHISSRPIHITSPEVTMKT